MTARPIKLFVDAHAFDSGYQGTQTFIRELYTGLLSQYPDLDIYWGAYHTDRIQAAFPSVKAENILPYQKADGGLSRFMFDIPRYLKKYKIDFGHFQYLSPKQQKSCRYIVTLHDVLYNTFPADFSLAYRASRNLLFGRSIRGAAIKTTVSGYSQTQIANDYNIAADKIHVIPNGVNQQLLQANITKAGAVRYISEKFGVENYILYVSRVEPRKNHALLLKKYLKLKLYQKGIPLVFVGDQSIFSAALESEVIGMTDEQSAMFHWFPQVSQADLTAFYTACRLFVYPSKGEGFGIPPLEAAICKAPVLCSSATAMSSYSFFEPYTFHPENENDFEQKLALMIDQPPTETRLNHIAHTVAAQYQWQHSSKLFYNLIQAHYPI